MEPGCELCRLLRQDAGFVVESRYWRVLVSRDQAFLGRSLIILKRHCHSLAALDKVEVGQWHMLLQTLQTALHRTFEATAFNWSCLMNDAYDRQPPKPHVHWHLRPRYRTTPVFEGVEYPDPKFGQAYYSTPKRLVDDELKNRIAEAIQSRLTN